MKKRERRKKKPHFISSAGHKKQTPKVALNNAWPCFLRLDKLDTSLPPLPLTIPSPPPPPHPLLPSDPKEAW